MPDSAGGLHADGVEHYRRGHPLRALRTLRRALAVAESANDPDGPPLIAAIWVSLALSVAEVEGVERGLEALAEAQRQMATIEDPALQVRLHSQHGLIATRAGRFDLAVRELDAAIGMIEFADAHDRFAILINSGNLRMHRGEIREARRLLAGAAEVAEAEGIDVGQFMALHNLGYALFLSGDFPAALARMQQADELDVEVSRGISSLDRARVLVECGLVREADETLAAAAAIFASDRLAQDLAEVDMARAQCALISGDVGAARKFAGRARDRFRRRGNSRWQRFAELTLLQADLADGRPPRRLAPVALALADRFRADGADQRARVASLVAAEALLATDQIVEARAVIGPSGRLRTSDPITLRLQARYVHAQVELAGGDASAARRQIRSGLAELADHQARFGGIDTRTASAVHGRRLAELDLAQAVASASAAGVLAALERSRAISSRLAPVTPPTDDESAELLTQLRQLVEASAAGGSAELDAQRRHLEQRIKQRSWTYAGADHADRPATVGEIRDAALDSDLALVAYVVVGGTLFATTFGPRRSRLVDLGPFAPIDALVRRSRADFDVLALDLLPAGLRAAADGSVRRSLAAIDQAVLAPLDLPDKRLVIIPTGSLGALAWGALPSVRGLPNVVTPSATAWLHAAERSHPALVTASRVAVFAGPELRRGVEEASAVAAAWSSRGSRSVDCHTDADASGGNLSAALTSADVVHVAAHGQHQTENPLFSSIRMADGPVFAHELERTAAHVVLSACELGAATMRPGDEALGLTRVLLQRGTRSVISSVARVGDAQAADAMAIYHQALAAGTPSDEALAEALAAQSEPVPFVCFGAAWSAQ